MATDAKTGQPIFHGSTRVGLNHVGSYQVSGQPWVTGSTELGTAKVHLIKFPTVAKSFTVINTNASGDIRVHFQSGSNATASVTVPGDAGEKEIIDTSDVIAKFHFITVPAGNSSVTFDTKCADVYISNPEGGTDNLDYQVFAELTNIPRARMFHLTGSGLTAQSE